MDILVCVKQIVALETPLRLAASGAALAVDERTEYRLNEFDEYAVEAALRLRETAGEAHVEVVSLGPPRVIVAIRRALGMGADRGIHLVTSTADDLDPFAVAHAIAAYARTRRYDLILTGVQSEDAMQGAVGPLIAARLGRPCATGVLAMQLVGGEIEVVRELEAGRRERLALSLPAVLTMQTGPDQPRYPSLSNMLRANRSELETIAIETLDSPPARQVVTRLTYPLPTRECLMLEGSAADKARRLRRMLVERNVW